LAIIRDLTGAGLAVGLLMTLISVTAAEGLRQQPKYCGGNDFVALNDGSVTGQHSPFDYDKSFPRVVRLCVCGEIVGDAEK
jgi:hypothetical protein